MNWVISSLIMFASSAALYLLVRKSSLLKISSHFNNLAMFLIPFFIFASFGIITHQNFTISFNQFIVILSASIFFSYLGNTFSVLSIEYAPNPGYSLIISKSYVVLTTLVSVILFHSELSLKNTIAILFIIVFSTLIMLSQKTAKKTVNRLWLPLSIGSFFCWGLLSIFSRYIFDQGVSPIVFLTYVVFIVSLFILAEMKIKNISFSIIVHNSKLFVLIGILSALFNLFMMEAIKIAPNIGYVNAINAASISVVTILAILLLKDEFSLRKFIGVIGTTIGLLILLL